MEEDAFDDNGWSRYFAPNAQRKVDPPKTECDLIPENLKGATENEESIVEEGIGDECMLQTEDDGNEIDFSISKLGEQKKVEDSKGYDASVDVKICEKDVEIPEDQTTLHVARDIARYIRYYKILHPDVDEGKQGVSPSKWPSLDLLSLIVIGKDKNCTKEVGKAGGDQQKAVTKSSPVESLSSKEGKGKNNRKEAEEPIGGLAKVATKPPHFVLSCKIEEDKDINSVKEARKAASSQIKAGAEPFHFESSSLELKKKDENYTKEETKADGEKAKAASDSPFFASSSVEGNKDKHIPDEEVKAVGDQEKALSLEEYKDKNSPDEEGKAIGNTEKALLKLTTFDSFSLKENKDTKNPDEEGKVVGDCAKSVTKSPSFDSSLLEENKDENSPDEEGKEVYDQEKALFKWSTSDSLPLKENKDKSSPLEDEKVVGEQPKAATESSLIESFPLKVKDTDKNHTKEAVQRVDNSGLHVNPGGLPSKSAEMEKGEKPQATDVNASKSLIWSISLKSSNFARSVLFAFSLSVLFSGAPGTLVVAPKDVIGLKGEEIRLRCSTQFQKAVYWERILVGSKEQQTIYFGINGMVNIEGSNGRIKIDSDPQTGRYDLVIKDLQPMDAATYICVDDNGIGEEKRAQLIVLDYFSCDMPMPSSGFMGENTVNLPVDNIQASCSLQYHGHVTPRFEWRLDSIQVNASRTTNGSTVKSVVTLRGTKEMDGAKLSSLPTVSSSQDLEGDTIPWWTSSQLKVNYIHLMFGEVAECQADSGMVPRCAPLCHYQQVEIPGDSVCYCMAVYNMNGVKHEIIFDKHPCYGLDSTSNKSSIIIMIAVYAAVVALLIAIIVILIVIIKRRSACKRSPAGSEDGLLPKQKAVDNNETLE